jgi:hypothetical protein
VHSYFFNKLMSRSNKLFLSFIGFLGPNEKEIKTTGLLVIFNDICKLAHSISNSVLKLLLIFTNLMFFLILFESQAITICLTLKS